jgi:branched-chain amino acid transport system substrate-binding protein
MPALISVRRTGRLNPCQGNYPMDDLLNSRRIGRRTVLSAGIKAGLVAGLAPLASLFVISARGEAPIKIGMVDPFTGVYAAFAKNEQIGAQYAVDEINKKGGVMGRQLQLLVEDSANDVGTGVQKTRKLIDRDGADIIFGDVNSGIAYAMSQVTSEKKKLHIVTGGHTDPITGKDCKWNVFRVCNTTTMDANSIADTLIEKFGKKWYFITPDYAYGHSVQASFVKKLKEHGGEFSGDLVPLGTVDYSSYLIKAKAYNPKVLINVMGGLDQVNSLKQFVQFGMDKQMAVGGALFELESILAVPKEAQIGWWVMEWWWDQPNVPHVKEFVDGIEKITGKKATARNWFGFVAAHSVGLVVNQEKTLDAVKLAHAMQGLKLPPEVALQPYTPFYRAGDHELMDTVFVGEVHPPKGGPEKVFTPHNAIPGDKAAGPVEETGCHVQFPA